MGLAYLQYFVRWEDRTIESLSTWSRVSHLSKQNLQPESQTQNSVYYTPHIVFQKLGNSVCAYITKLFSLAETYFISIFILWNKIDNQKGSK